MFAYIREYGGVSCRCWAMIEPRARYNEDDVVFDIIEAVGRLPANFDYRNRDPLGYLEPDTDNDDFTIYPATSKRVPADKLIAEAMKRALLGER